MRPSEPQTCVLCGLSNADVRMALLRYQDETGRYYFATDARCADHDACRDRVEAAGFDWPLAGWKKPRAVTL